MARHPATGRKKRMATTAATAVQNKTEVFAEELNRIAMKVLSKMSKREREERLRKLNAILSSGSEQEHA
jgi:hypothetical protein